jgi:hypothetical protein
MDDKPHVVPKERSGRKAVDTGSMRPF